MPVVVVSGWRLLPPPLKTRGDTHNLCVYTALLSLVLFVPASTAAMLSSSSLFTPDTFHACTNKNKNIVYVVKQEEGATTMATCISSLASSERVARRRSCCGIGRKFSHVYVLYVRVSKQRRHRLPFM